MLIDGRLRMLNVKGKIMHNLGNVCRAAAHNYMDIHLFDANVVLFGARNVVFLIHEEVTHLLIPLPLAVGMSCVFDSSGKIR